jgi:hypothetical protein
MLILAQNKAKKIFSLENTPNLMYQKPMQNASNEGFVGVPFLLGRTKANSWD